MTSTTQHIGAAGGLLVQYRLLKFGIDSARLTTDSGIDLVAYAPGSSTAVTIQVKTAWADGAAGYMVAARQGRKPGSLEQNDKLGDNNERGERWSTERLL